MRFIINCRSSVARHYKARLPQPGSIIACSSTSPLDALYLAAIFDPVFTASFPSTRKVRPITLLQAIMRAFSYPLEAPANDTELMDLRTLTKKYPHQPIAVFPECTTTNGRGILPLSPSLLTTSPTSKIFPINLRYTAPDITTPIPRTYFTFLWNLLSKPTHCIRVRIAEALYNQKMAPSDTRQDERDSSCDTLLGSDESEAMSASERRTLDRVAEALARLGRVKRVGLGLKEKQNFITTYLRRKRA